MHTIYAYDFFTYLVPNLGYWQFKDIDAYFIHQSSSIIQN